MDDPHRYRRTGLVYFVLGVAIMAITASTPGLASPERRADLVHLLIGAPFFALFALMIAYGDRMFAWLLRCLGTVTDRARRLGTQAREKLVMLLTLSALGRTFIFTANGFGWKPGVTWRPVELSLEAAAPMPRLLVNATLMVIIVVFLARASWLPFLRRRRG